MSSGLEVHHIIVASWTRHHTALQPYAHFADSCRHAVGHRWLLGSEPN